MMFARSAGQGDEGERACFSLEIRAREVGEFGQPRFDFFRRHQQMQCDFLAIIALAVADLLLTHPVLNRGQQVVADGDGDFWNGVMAMCVAASMPSTAAWP